MGKLVSIGNVARGRSGALVLVPDVYSTERRQRGGGTRHAASAAYDPDDVGELEMRWGPRGPRRGTGTEMAPRGRQRGDDDASRWAEKEIVPGLRVRVLRGQPWNAERLDTGQILLSPQPPEAVEAPRPHRGRNQGYEETGMVGALFRDTDGFEVVKADPKPVRGRGDVW